MAEVGFLIDLRCHPCNTLNTDLLHSGVVQLFHWLYCVFIVVLHVYVSDIKATGNE